MRAAPAAIFNQSGNAARRSLQDSTSRRYRRSRRNYAWRLTAGKRDPCISGMPRGVGPWPPRRAAAARRRRRLLVACCTSGIGLVPAALRVQQGSDVYVRGEARRSCHSQQLGGRMHRLHAAAFENQAIDVQRRGTQVAAHPRSLPACRPGSCRGNMDELALPATRTFDLAGHSKVVTALEADSAGARLVAGGFDGKAALFDFGGLKRWVVPSCALRTATFCCLLETCVPC